MRYIDQTVDYTTAVVVIIARESESVWLMDDDTKTEENLLQYDYCMCGLSQIICIT